MARPQNTQRTRRVQVSVASAPAAQAGVFAPLTGVAAPSKGAMGLQSLAQALGAAVDLGTKALPAYNDMWEKQGRADQALGKVDESKQQWNTAYEKGVYESAVLQQYNDAERSVVDRAARELDRSMPLDKQAAQVDAWMKEELGDLVSDDPNARRLVADRYRTFIEQTTNKILEQTTQEHLRLTQDATLADVGDDIRKGGTGRVGEAIERLASVSGDRTAATQAVLGSILQVATEVAQDGDIATAREEVERILAAIPSEITLADGTVMRPRSSPAMAASIKDASARAIDMVERREVEEAQKALLDSGKHHIDATNAGELVPWSWYENLAKRKVITDQQALSWYDANQSAFEARRKKVSSESMLDQWLLDPNSDWRWYNGLTLPDGDVTTEKKFQERFDFLAQQALASGGPEAFGAVVSLSQRTGLPYTPMKTAMSQLNGDNVTTIARYFPMYQQLRAAGMAEMYVDEKAMPYWQIAEAMHQTGVDPTTEQGQAQLRDRLKRVEPDRVREFVRDGRIAISKRIDTAVVHDGWLNTTVSDLGNAVYAKAELMRLAELNLQLMVDPETALKNAAQQLQRSHTVIEVNGEEHLIPNERGLDMGTLKEAVTYFEDQILPQAAARAGLEPDEVRFEITRLGGRETEIRIVDFNGNNIADGGRFWSTQELVRMYREASGERAAAEARRSQRRKSDMVRLTEEMQRSGAYWDIATQK